MVGYVHAFSGVGFVETRWSLDIAREVSIRWGKRGLPDVRELIQDVRDFVVVGLVVHEDHRPFTGQDNLR